MDKKSEKKTGKFWEKLKSIKHIEIIVPVIFGAVLLLIVFGNFQTADGSSTTTYDLTEYAKVMEQRVAKVLSQIDGAGKVDVMINFEKGVEMIPATNTDGDKDTIVLVSGKPVVLAEIQPKISGVLVVAEGAGNVKVKLELTKAVCTLLSVDSNYIEIFTKSKS